MTQSFFPAEFYYLLSSTRRRLKSKLLLNFLLPAEEMILDDYYFSASKLVFMSTDACYYELLSNFSRNAEKSIDRKLEATPEADNTDDG